MKRLVFCFDGTWNRLDAPAPTNVVLTAQSVSPIAKDQTIQIIHYDQGVGTAKGWKWRGGLFGEGLMDNISDAYTFLVFNYEIGDEIYVFGFSRGAFTARSFVGLLRTVGIIRRADAGRITEAVQKYQRRKVDEDHDSEDLLRYRLESSPLMCVDQKEDAWRCRNKPGYASGASPVLRIRYLGVWDTVGSLGIPNDMFISRFANRQYLFHDTDLSDLVVSARHAVSIDEQRKSFAPTLWTNFEALNAALGFAPSEEHAPYQQKWFPGTHGSVGGGGPERGLSDFALDWIVSGARAAGLQLDTEEGSRIFSLSPNALAPLENVKASSDVLSVLMSKLPTAHRLPGPDQVTDVSSSAIQRWKAPAEELPEGKPYRPPTLARISREIDALPTQGEMPALPQNPNVPLTPTPEPVPGAHYRVVRKDTLTGIALKAYHNASMDGLILKANNNILSDPDRIYVGQVLYIPQQTS